MRSTSSNTLEEHSILQQNSPIQLTEAIHDLPQLHTCDIIGDLHGCLDELIELLEQLGHNDLLRDDLQPSSDPLRPKLLFVGDIVDRGDKNIATMEFVHRLVSNGYARATMGNHDYRFVRWLRGEDVTIAHGLGRTIKEYEEMSGAQKILWEEHIQPFLESLPYAIRFDEGRGIVVHAAWRPRMKLESELKKIRYYAIYGPTTGEKTETGFPIRIDWAKSYRGPEFVIYGHQVFLRPYRNEFAIGIDTGCAFGGALSALRYPSMEVVSVKSHYARASYNGPIRDPEGD